MELELQHLGGPGDLRDRLKWCRENDFEGGRLKKIQRMHREYSCWVVNPLPALNNVPLPALYWGIKSAALKGHLITEVLCFPAY